MIFDEQKVTLSAPGSSPWCMIRPNRNYSVLLGGAAGSGIDIEFTPDGGTTVELVQRITDLGTLTGQLGQLGKIRATAPAGHSVTTTVIIRST